MEGFKKIWTRFGKTLEGWPESVLTLLLILLSVIVLLVALFAPVQIKGLLAAWIILP